MRRHIELVVARRFRYRVWFAYFLICVAVYLFPPWIVSSMETYPTPFNVDWFFSSNFHFWTYQPVAMANVMDTTGYCTVVEFNKFKHLNYCALGIETVFLGLLALILSVIIRRHEASLAHDPMRLTWQHFSGK
jgi:hypothetical protein